MEHKEETRLEPRMIWKDLPFFKNHGPMRMFEKLSEKEGGHLRDVQPAVRYWYKALQLTPYEKTVAVILGQDPYPTRGMACGLAFSVLPEQRELPPSLVNIFQEYTSDLHFPWPRTGDLSSWAERGVLLLNSSLTVSAGNPGSHKDVGWSELVGEVLDALSNRKPSPVFILWGVAARTLFGNRRGQTITSVHPSPLSAHRGFFGSRPFSTCNALLRKSRQQPVNWRLP